MQIAVTGAAGFLGRRLIETLLRRGYVIAADGSRREIDSICAFDVIDLEGYTDPRIRPLAGDIVDPAKVAQLIGADTISVFHLAAVVSSQAEEDFDLGMRVNIDATRMLMERVRAVAPGARFVTTSSVAVFGGVLPDIVPDTHVWQPQSSYGTQKAINDLLLSDYSRRGFLDGRSLRMPTIVVRPGKPNRAASSFASGIIREPLAGIDAVCPVSLDTVLWLMSPALAIRNILHGHDLEKAALGGRSVINMPGLSVTVADMLHSLRRLAGGNVADRVQIVAEPAIQRIVNSWPGNFSADTARGLGFTHDVDFDAVVRAFMSEQSIQTG